MYPVFNQAEYEEILESDLSEIEKRIEALQFRFQEMPTFHLDPFNPCRVMTPDDHTVAVCNNEAVAALLVLARDWYPKIYAHFKGDPDGEQRNITD